MDVDGKNEKISAMHKDGKSALQIAMEIGMTRNAVIGRIIVYRLNATQRNG